jgi:hypothetical protein
MDIRRFPFATGAPSMRTISHPPHARPGTRAGRSPWSIEALDARGPAFEGVALGIIVATIIWGWVALVDAVAGQPFRTFQALGGVPSFTTLHYLLNIAYCVAVVSTIRGALRTPSLIIGAIFVFLIFEVGFSMMTVLLSTATLGPSAWVTLLGGNLLGATFIFAVLSRRYPLATQLRNAEDER